MLQVEGISSGRPDRLLLTARKHCLYLLDADPRLGICL